MQSVIGGLPLETSLCSPIQILRYFLLLILFDLLAGILATNCVSHAKTFLLLRSGWKCWFRQILLRVLCAVGCAALLILLPIWIAWPKPDALYGWLLFSLYAASCASIQSFLIAYAQTATAGLVPVIFFQLCSVFLSKLFPGNWKLLLFGNWGSFVRTTGAGEAQGVSLLACVALNFVSLVLISIFGWRLIRHHQQKR